MISFVIPAHNEERLLGSTLVALHAAAHAVGEPYELIVVDDDSTDTTPVVAQRHGARIVAVRHRQIAAARNAGAAAALGEQLLFVDADTQVSARVLGAAIQAMRNGAVGGGARMRFDGRVPLYGRALAWLWHWIQRAGNLAAGSFIFCTREAFEAAGGFNQTLFAAEDVALSRRLQRLGRFVIVREIVETSGRTVRSYSGAEALGMTLDFLLHAPRYLKGRRGYWYRQRREGRTPKR